MTNPEVSELLERVSRILARDDISLRGRVATAQAIIYKYRSESKS